jgi:hypothetical protein
MGLISGIIGAFGARKAGKAAKKEGKIDAKQIRKSGDIQTLLSERAEIKGIGATRADVGAAGLALAGSASDLIAEQQRDAEFQRKTITEQTEFDAKKAIRTGKAANTASKFAAAGSVIGGFESTAAKLFGLGG